MPLRSNGRLIAYLAVRAPKFVSRKALVSTIWPEVDMATGLNRLRVAISKLRQVMPDALVLEAEGIALNTEIVESDAVQFQEMVRESGDTTSEEAEFDSLMEAILYFTRNLRTHQFDSWETEHLRGPLQAYRDAVLRLSDLGEELHRDALVSQTCQVALRAWPEDAELWKRYLLAARALGEGEGAVRELASTKNKDLLATPDIREITDNILNQDSTELEDKSFTGAESKVAVEVLQAILKSRKDLARAVLCSPETLSLAGANPKPMLSLLEQAVSDPMPGDEHWERCMARMCGLKAWLGDAGGVFETGQLVVDNSQNPVILRAVWNAISLAHSIRRQWPEAMEAIATTIAYAGQTGNDIDVLSAQGNRASYLWQQGDYRGSEAEYQRILAEVRAIDTPQAEFEYAIGFGNRAFIPVMQGDWSRALQLIEETNELRTNGPGKIPMGLLLPCLGMVRLALGDRSGVFRLMRQGFFEANASGSVRIQQITFEFAACSLAFTEHRAFGRAAMDWVEAWRTRTKLPRAKAEKDLANIVFGPGRAAELRPEEPAPNVGREILRRLRHATR